MQENNRPQLLELLEAFDINLLKSLKDMIFDIIECLVMDFRNKEVQNNKQSFVDL